jgi:hypothetical protein
MSEAHDGLGQVWLLLTGAVNASRVRFCQHPAQATPRRAQSVECKSLHLVVVCSSPTVGVFQARG